MGVGALYTQGEVGAFIPTPTPWAFIESAIMENLSNSRWGMLLADRALFEAQTELATLRAAVARLLELDIENDGSTCDWVELQECIGAVALAMQYPLGRPPKADEQCDDNSGLPTTEV